MSKGCRMGGLVHVNTSLYSAVSLTRETCTRAWVHVSQNKVTTSFLLLQQHFTYSTCSIFKANLQKGRLLKALHRICMCKADPRWYLLDTGETSVPVFKKDQREQKEKELGNCRFMESLLLNPGSQKAYDMNYQLNSVST